MKILVRRISLNMVRLQCQETKPGYPSNEAVNAYGELLLAVIGAPANGNPTFYSHIFKVLLGISGHLKQNKPSVLLAVIGAPANGSPIFYSHIFKVGL